MQTDWESDEEYERLPSIQTREQGHTLRRHTYTPEIRTHNIHKHTNTCAQRAGLSKCRLNVLSGMFFSQRDKLLLFQQRLCVGGSEFAAQASLAINTPFNLMIKLTIKMIYHSLFFPWDSNVCFARTCIRTEEKRKEKQHPKPGLI